MKRLNLALVLALGLTLPPAAVSAGGPHALHQGGFRLGAHAGDVNVFISHGHPFVHHVHPHFVHPHVIHHGLIHPHSTFIVVHPAPQLVWVPGFWWWNGFQWVWISGHWVVPSNGLSFRNPCD